MAKQKNQDTQHPPPPVGVSNLTPPLLPALALLLIIAAAFWPAFSAAYIWDDITFLLDSKPVQGGLDGLYDIWFRPGTTTVEGHYWPMPYTFFWLEHKLWGYNALGYHTVNILLHGINTLLLWRLLTHLTIPGAWLIAAVFALHPTHVEPVAWIISRKDMLSTLFYLLTASYWFHYREQPQDGRSPAQQILPYLPILLLHTAGMLSKTVVITLPVALLICVWWQHGHITRRDLRLVAPLFILGFIIAALDYNYYTGRAIIGFNYEWYERPFIIFKALWMYVGTLLWPHPLPVIYLIWDVSPANPLNWWPLLATLLAALALWLTRYRLGRGPVAGVLFFVVTLSPMLGFADNSYMGISFVADRYQYLASVGLTAVLIGAAIRVCQHFSGQHLVLRGAQTLAALLLLSYGLLTFQQAQIYKDFFTYFSYISEVNPEEYQGHYNLSLAYLDREEYENAERAARRAIELRPESDQAYQNLAVALNNQERYEETLEALKQVAALTKPSAENYYHSGFMASKVGRMDEAEQLLLQSLQLDPDSKEARNHLAFVYLETARYEKAIELDPNIRQSLEHAASQLFNEGNYKDALKNYQHIIGMDPNNAQILFNHGLTLERLQRLPEAQKSYQQSLSIDPNYQQTLNQLAALHFTAKRYQQALKLYRHLLTLNPDSAEAHSNLGSAMAQSGNFREAIKHFERALELNPELPSALINIKLARQRLGEGG
ncbi:MAG: tetratricopeptide repeat protein [Gammaproteobacteria bacterium]